MNYCLGKTAARPDAPAFRLARFTAPTALPSIPESFGHEGVIGPQGWYLLGNDKWGNCVWAGQAHAVMQWTREAGGAVLFNTPGVLSDYTASTGFDPKRPETDQGSDMQAAADYWRKTGVIDGSGKRHVIVAHLGLDPERIRSGDLSQVHHAAYLFGGLGIGVQLPSSAFVQTDTRKPWSVVEGSPNEGGHYIWLNARRVQGKLVLKAVTWGIEQTIEEAFLIKYCDEARVYVSEEALINRKSPEGFDFDQLIRVLRTL